MMLAAAPFLGACDVSQGIVVATEVGGRAIIHAISTMTSGRPVTNGGSNEAGSAGQAAPAQEVRPSPAMRKRPLDTGWADTAHGGF